MHVSFAISLLFAQVIVLCYPISPGLQLKLDGQDFPFASFTYTPSSLTDKLTPVDWKLLVTENVQSQHIRCHKLQMGDNLPDLIDIFQKAHAVAVVLINTSENGFLDPSFLIGTKKSHFPVLILKKSCGIELLKKVGQCSKDVLAKITVESFVDPVRTLHETGTAPAHTNSDKMAPKEQGQWYSLHACAKVTKNVEVFAINLK